MFIHKGIQKNNRMKKAIFCLSTMVAISRCTSSEIGNSKDVNPETIYTSYNISYKEGDESVNCRAQFRFGGNKGTTLVLNTPAQVSLDEQQLKIDSNKVEGAYYFKSLPIAGFSGKHFLDFTDINKKIYKEAFVFTPFRLKSTIPATISKQALTLEFAGLQNGTPINVSIVDTASSTQNINAKPTIAENKITIAAAEIGKLKAGPITIEIETNDTQNLKNTTKEGGIISLVYRLKTKKVVLKN